VSTQNAQYRDYTLPPVQLDVSKREDGTLLLKSQYALIDFDPIIARNFFRQARLNPDKPVYAQRKREANGTRGD